MMKTIEQTELRRNEVLSELRSHKEAISSEYGFSVRQIGDALMKLQQGHSKLIRVQDRSSEQDAAPEIRPRW